ncbi:MAG TPA: glycosyltransferase family 2 protein [Verrucomicrobiae bacterium]|nr:glycosyltransferase family 2 protein [Verrucomicrobiae bacterium]
MAPDLTIIIVNWNTRDLLRNCLQSIQASTGSLRIQTIVVDNDSKDGSPEMVRELFPSVELIKSGGNLGFARANNLAVPKAASDLVLFLNPDTEVKPESLERMISFIRQNPKVGCLGCKIRDASGEHQELGIQRFPSPFTELLRLLFFSRKTQPRLASILPYHNPHISGYVKKLFGACLLVRKSVLDQVGSFDERFFMYCEDVDLCRRIEAGGWSLYYLSDVEILHLGASASAKAPGAFAVLMTCQSLSLLMRKYYGPVGSAAYRSVAFLGALPRLFLLLVWRCIAILGIAKTNRDLSGTAEKYLTMAKWSLGLERPQIKN